MKLNRNFPSFGFPKAVDRNVIASGVFEAADEASVVLNGDGAYIQFHIGATVPKIQLILDEHQIFPFELVINNADAAAAVELAIPAIPGGYISTQLSVEASKKNTYIVGFDRYTDAIVPVLKSTESSTTVPVVALETSAGSCDDEQSYYANMPESYTKDYSYEESKSSFPWVCFYFTTGGTGNLNLAIYHDGKPCVFAGTSANVGTVSADKLSIKLKKTTGYVMFEAINDLSQQNPKGEYVAVFSPEGGVPFTVKATV